MGYPILVSPALLFALLSYDFMDQNRSMRVSVNVVWVPSFHLLSCSSSLSGAELCFWYVNSSGKCVQSKDDAAVTFNG